MERLRKPDAQIRLFEYIQQIRHRPAAGDIGLERLEMGRLRWGDSGERLIQPPLYNSCSQEGEVLPA